jgi:hypothetical protein
VDTDVIADRTARLAPLGDADTEDLLHGLRSSTSLFGPHATATSDAGAVRDVLTRVGCWPNCCPRSSSWISIH